MFRQLRAHITNDSDRTVDAGKIAEFLQCNDGIVQDGGCAIREMTLLVTKRLRNAPRLRRSRFEAAIRGRRG